MLHYSLEEIAKHNTEDNLWIIIDGNVYNVTKFLEEHPGGRKALLNYGGKDASISFHKIKKHFENEKLQEYLDKFFIGKVANIQTV